MTLMIEFANKLKYYTGADKKHILFNCALLRKEKVQDLHGQML